MKKIKEEEIILDEGTFTSKGEVSEIFKFMATEDEAIKEYLGQDKIMLTAMLDVYALANAEQIAKNDPERMDAATEIKVYTTATNTIQSYLYMNELLFKYTLQVIVSSLKATGAYQDKPEYVTEEVNKYIQGLYDMAMRKVEEWLEDGKVMEFYDKTETVEGEDVPTE